MLNRTYVGYFYTFMQMTPSTMTYIMLLSHLSLKKRRKLYVDVVCLKHKIKIQINFFLLSVSFLIMHAWHNFAFYSEYYFYYELQIKSNNKNNSRKKLL